MVGVLRRSRVAPGRRHLRDHYGFCGRKSNEFKSGRN